MMTRSLDLVGKGVKDIRIGDDRRIFQTEKNNVNRDLRPENEGYTKENKGLPQV